MEEPTPNSSRKPTKGPNPERMAADRELYALLQREGFAGPHMEALRADLWRYGWRCLRKWMRDGEIIERCLQKKIKVSAWHTEVEAMRRRADLREDLAADSLEEAVKTFTQVALPGGWWKPDKGATMRTYFIHGCLFAFREAFKKWSAGFRKHLRDVANSVLDTERACQKTSAEEVAFQRDTLTTILRHANAEQAAICALILDRAANQKEIGAELGMTSRAVEGQMRRLRNKALELKWTGAINVRYGPPRPRSAGGRRTTTPTPAFQITGGGR